MVLTLVACGDAEPGVAALTLPSVIDLPYVVAGAGATVVDVRVANPGDADATGPDGAPLPWRLDGAGFALVAAPTVVPAGGDAVITIGWDGAAAEAIAGASLSVDGTAGPRAAEVWAVAGDPALPAADFAPVTGAGGVVIGASAVVAMPTAPFPAPGRPWTDARVHLFVPTDYRERDAHDLVLHFHGHSTTIDATVPAHRYREQLWSSGADVILAVPQGPVNTASGDFGKLASPAGTAAFLDEVLIALYRAGRITRPVVGDVTLTSHSGGYLAVAANLAADAPFTVRQVHLFDSLYGQLATYQAFVVGGGRLRSDHTATGGTDGNNRALVTSLTAAGVAVATAPDTRALRDDRAVIYPTPASHEGSTRERDAFGAWLRWAGHHGRRGPRAMLRTATATADEATVTWLAPIDDEVSGWRVERSTDGGASWTTAAAVAADATSARVPLTAAATVRVVPVVAGVDAPQPTDAVRVSPTPAGAAPVLVVDGFDRVVDGSWGALAHDLAARVGAAVDAPVHTAARAAVTEDGLALGGYRAVLWLCGDDSVDDHTFTAAERAALDGYLAAGGHLVLSGSEIGYELGPQTDGAAWLARTAGAVFARDDAGTSTAQGAGPLAALASFGFGGPDAPYREEFPDTFTTTGGGVVLLQYAGGAAAAVGLAHRAALVGFPLEVIDRPDELAAVVAALLAFVGP